MSSKSMVSSSGVSWAHLAARGQELHLEGSLKEALKHFKDALEINPQVAELYYCVAQVLIDLALWEEAAHFYQEATRLKVDWVDAYLMLGVCQEQFGETKKAKANYHKAIELDPLSGAGHFNIACLFHAEKDFDGASNHYLKAYQLKEQIGQCALALAKIAHLRKKYLAAEKWYRIANESKSMTDGDLSNFGVVLQELAKYEEALSVCDDILTRDPEHQEALYNRSFPLLLKGDYKQGWKAFEYRNTIVKRSEPLWEGDNIEKQKLLVAFEQGAGDVIQCARFFPEVRKRVGKLLVECPKSLHRLIHTMGFVDELLDVGEEVLEVDFQVPVFSLPKIFGTQLESLASGEAYLKLDKKIQAKSHPFRAGLVWAGDPNHGRDLSRSCSISELAPLFKLKNVEWVSLQKGQRMEDLKSFPFIGDWGSECKDFYDTAERLEQLDLVITVDTSVLHLCGALGKPVWGLIQYAPDWRWLLAREDSPWYPSVRLFRQNHLGDWRGLIKRVKAELEIKIESKQ
ncbi:MAG: tetratricopeptide repeat-containing glycosyltransferase family protein [Verrucomicrobiota bacterium]